MTSATAPFTLEQIGTGTARFPSGVPIPSNTDASVDPYIKTRSSNDVQVEATLFWPQEKGIYPGLVLLHEWWGFNVQVKDLGARFACEGYAVIIPNLYSRLGGMVTANAEVADALMGKLNETLVLQDINSCCEYLNTLDYVKRNIHAVVGFGMGGSYALRFACRRKRLRAAVSYYGRIGQIDGSIKDLFCPVLYHHGGQDEWVPASDVDRLRTAAAPHGKNIDIRMYADAPHAFANDMRVDSYRADIAMQAWAETAAFLKSHLHGA